MCVRILLLAIVWSCLTFNLLAQDDHRENKTPAGDAESPSTENGQTDRPAPHPKEVLSVVRYALVDRVDDGILPHIRNVLVALQSQAEPENRKSTLILEIAGGPGTFGQVLDLARELTSARYSKVRTVAWIPGPGDGRALDGFKAILPLACREIVMHPDAVTGDFGRGQPIDDDERRFVINMVERRHNSRVNGALAAGMCDPQTAVLSIKVDSGRGVVETRLVTREELRRVHDSDITIPEVVTIKEKGIPLLLSGREACKHGVLTMHLAEDRTDLARIYGFAPDELRPDNIGGEAPKVRLIKIEGPIDDHLKEYVSREIQRAKADDANLIIFEIDTPGGKLFAAQSIASALANLDPRWCRSIAYIPKQAIGGGEMIAFGCDEIIVHRHSRIGPLIPVTAQPDWAEHMPGKVLSVIREMFRELAERKGRPPALFEAMADKDLVVYKVTHKRTGRVSYMSKQELEAVADEWNQDEAVPESREGVAMALTGQRAFELGIAERPVRNLDELKSRLGIPIEQVLTGQRALEPEFSEQPDRTVEQQATATATPQSWVNFAGFWILVASVSGGIIFYTIRRARP